MNLKVSGRENHNGSWNKRLMLICTLFFTEAPVRAISLEINFSLPQHSNHTCPYCGKKKIITWLMKKINYWQVSYWRYGENKKSRFWHALCSTRMQNDDVIQHWNSMGSSWQGKFSVLPSLEDTQAGFLIPYEEVTSWLERTTINYRTPVSSAKHLAITLHWLVQDQATSQFELLFGIGKSTDEAIVHDTVSVLKDKYCCCKPSPFQLVKLA